MRSCVLHMQEAEAGAFDRVQRLQAALEQPHRDNQEGYAAATLVSPAVGGMRSCACACVGACFCSCFLHHPPLRFLISMTYSLGVLAATFFSE